MDQLLASVAHMLTARWCINCSNGSSVNDVTHRRREGDSRMRDVGGGVKGCVTSFTHVTSAQGLARESWMIALVHYTGLRGTARMAQATENDI